ncbi:MAG TPA: methyltransferase domain-containing protein [Candidatus Paceibacterota bacterium]|nr:methyltransferase domain-containing protein [Candidatus Paceibacterota bacterium]
MAKVWYRLMFNYPPLSLEKVDYEAYWRDKRGGALGSLSGWQADRAALAARIIGSGDPVMITDIGSGDGSILKYLNERIKISRMIGVDLSPLALQQAEKFGVEPVLLDINNLEELAKLPETDYTLMLEILEHVPYSEQMLSVAHGKSRKGVIFSFPNTGFFVHRFRLLFGRFPLQWRLHPGEHLRYWTDRDLKWWLRSLGYKNYRVFYYRGMPILNKIWPSLFAAGFVVFVPKSA